MIERIASCNEYELQDHCGTVTLCASCAAKGDHNCAPLGRIIHQRMGDCEGSNCVHYRECRACAGYGRLDDRSTCPYCRGEGRILASKMTSL